MTDITKVEILDNSTVEVTGFDLDTIWTSKCLVDEATEADEVTYRFDLNTQGQRIYLYRICKSCKATADKTTMQDKIMALAGQIIYINPAFIVK